MNNVKTIIERGVTMNLELKDRLEQICGKTLIEASNEEIYVSLLNLDKTNAIRIGLGLYGLKDNLKPTRAEVIDLFSAYNDGINNIMFE